MITRKSCFIAIVAAIWCLPTVSSYAHTDEQGGWDVRSAVDQRDLTSPLLEQAVEQGNHDALRQWGLLGADACVRIRPFLTHEDESVLASALTGVANCRDHSAFRSIVEIAQTHVVEAVRISALRALGFASDEADRPLIAAEVSRLLADNASSDAEKAAAINGLMQSITYAGLTPAQLPALDMNGIVTAAGMRGDHGLQAAYLLSRMNGLSLVVSAEQMLDAFNGDIPSIQKSFLVRALPQFGEPTFAKLFSLARGKDERLALRALSVLGQVNNQNSISVLQETLSSESVHRQQAALASLAAHAENSPSLRQQVISYTNHENGWLAVTALRGLGDWAPELVLEVSQRWLAGEDYYRAFVAMGVLARSEEGRIILNEYAEANSGTIRGREAAIALDPSIEAVEKPRKTPSVRLVQSYLKRQLVLETTRGTICIAPEPVAPYASVNFMLLADAGKMDGMLWHRVISNFVAQAGQSEDLELATWGTIREEWSPNVSHAPGSVGVATAGPDTGSAQFFINTSHNLHLDGRYTVFGHVTGGMKAAYELQEGDVIVRARTERLNAEICAP